jgi:hypothetical protein
MGSFRGGVETKRDPFETEQQPRRRNGDLIDILDRPDDLEPVRGRSLSSPELRKRVERATPRGRRISLREGALPADNQSGGADTSLPQSEVDLIAWKGAGLVAVPTRMGHQKVVVRIDEQAWLLPGGFRSTPTPHHHGIDRRLVTP